MESLNVYALAKLIEHHSYIVDHLLCYSFGRLHVRNLWCFEELYRQYIIRQIWDGYIMNWGVDEPIPTLPQFPSPVSLQDPQRPYYSMMLQAPTMEDFCVRLYDSVERERGILYHSLLQPERRRCFYISSTPYFIEMEIGQFYVVGGMVKLFMQNPIYSIGRLDSLDTSDQVDCLVYGMEKMV